MFSAPTRRAMLALAAGDLEGTQSDRDAFARFLGSMCGGPSVITKKAAAARLGVTRQTVHALVKADVLDGASGAGGRDLGDCAKLREALERCADWGERIDHQLGSSDETVYTFRGERCLAHNISECARAALAAPATAEKSSAVGDAAKLREACANIAEYARSAMCHTTDTHVLGYLNQIEGWAKAALAEPVKNCEVGTAKEQAARFFALCNSNKCSSCPCRFTEKTDCALIWAQMPYEEGGAK